MASRGRPASEVPAVTGALFVEPKRTVDLGGDARVEHTPGWLPVAEADTLLADLLRTAPWGQPLVQTPAGMRLTPRLTCWYGPIAYNYSGHREPPHAMPSSLVRLAGRTGYRFNAALLNMYRDGADSVAWHADDEPEIDCTVIASVSLGDERRFLMRHRYLRQTEEFRLRHGDLLVMHDAQREWVHSIPKQARAGARINITFRLVRVPA